MTHDLTVAAMAGGLAGFFAAISGSAAVLDFAAIISISILSGTAAVFYSRWENKKIMKASLDEHVELFHKQQRAGETEFKGDPGHEPG
jgi:uncharacterized membrane protein YjjP (DUF1212 family)